jgi:hypothetical protein
MLRLTVTQLESLRYWKDKEDGDLALLVDELTKKIEPTPQMLAGRALAKLFETATGRDLNVEKVDGWEFRFALEGEFALPPVRELKAEVPIATPSGPVLLVGKVDGLHGFTVRDQKLTENPDMERYFDSLQWRAYLAMFGAREFVYDVFVAKYERGKGHTDAEGNYIKGEIIGPPSGVVTITEYHPIRFYAYPDLQADVQLAVNELAQVYVDYVIPELARREQKGAA